MSRHYNSSNYVQLPFNLIGLVDINLNKVIYPFHPSLTQNDKRIELVIPSQKLSKGQLKETLGV